MKPDIEVIIKVREEAVKEKLQKEYEIAQEILKLFQEYKFKPEIKLVYIFKSQPEKFAI